MRFFVWQLTGLLIATTVLFAAAFTFFPTFMNGQVGQLLHLDMPGISLLGLEGGGGGTLLLIKWSLIFLGLL